ncbi:hypothetical protein [Streptomyces marincola]|uniref:Uncharacterized protein n=1 Tax=Streptomyces marincola TaxID=2878388 RepID=A0A1W7D0A0_9ACTN|nr:hypothetical protein [Streptomyces marincola]ARQ70464.1 hypothetical protein CAG99_17880 [Streptomyces marincola]
MGQVRSTRSPRRLAVGAAALAACAALWAAPAHAGTPNAVDAGTPNAAHARAVNPAPAYAPFPHAARAAPAGGVAEERPGAGAGDDRGGVRVTPVSPRPGDDVDLRVHGCAGDTGVAKSPAFVAPARLAPGPGGGLVGEARVRSTAEPGVHRIDVMCDAKHGEVTGRLIITGPDGQHGPPGKPGKPDRTGRPEGPEHGEEPGHRGPEHQGRSGPHGGSGGHPEALGPTGPVRAGGGGTAAGGADGPPAAAGAAVLTLLSCALAGCALLAVRRLHARGG